MGMIVARVVELVVGKLEVVGLVVEIVGEDCLKEVEIVGEDCLKEVEVVDEDCSMNIHTCFGTHQYQAFDHQT